MKYAHSLGSMISAKLEGKLNEPLDYVNTILQIIQNIFGWPDSEDNSALKTPYLYIVSEKSRRRVFIVKDNQLVSFSFPFNIGKSKDKSTGVITWVFHYEDILVTPKIHSICMGLLSDMLNARKLKSKDSYQSFASALNQYDSDVQNAIRVFEGIMLSEPGYIRCDYDPTYANGHYHPLRHFDVNYTKTCHYKLGLYRMLEKHEFEDVLNIDTECSYVEEHSLLMKYYKTIGNFMKEIKHSINRMLLSIKNYFKESPFECKGGKAKARECRDATLAGLF